MGFTELVSSGSALPSSEAVKIVVEGKEFEVTTPPTSLLASGKLQRTEDGSYAFSDEWNVRSSQFSALFYLLHSETT